MLPASLAPSWLARPALPPCLQAVAELEQEAPLLLQLPEQSVDLGFHLPPRGGGTPGLLAFALALPAALRPFAGYAPAILLPDAGHAAPAAAAATA